MKPDPDRRKFLTRSALVAAGAGLAVGAKRVPLLGRPARGKKPASKRAEGASFRTKLSKALIINKPTREILKRLRDAGFDGVEAGILEVADAAKCRAEAEKLGMRIHSVLRGWASFNSSDSAKVESSLKLTEKALRAAQAFGADAVLTVPCRIGGVKSPYPWEFHIDFDEETGHIRKVVVGDNAPYEAYIKAHNHAVDTSREAVKRLIPVAEKTGVVIALENVWNNLWVKPRIFENFVASFRSPWVKAYFDIGNHVKYAAPEEWILTLGDLIAKCHVKDFKLDPSDPKGQGKFVAIRDGSVRWPVVRTALDRVGYSGWMTIEGGGLSVQENSKRLDLILAGK